MMKPTKRPSSLIDAAALTADSRSSAAGPDVPSATEEPDAPASGSERREDAPDDEVRHDRHDERVDGSFDHDLKELSRPKRLASTQQREDAGEDHADRERREQVLRLVSRAQPKKRAGHHVGRVLDAQKHDREVINEENRERQTKVNPSARSITKAIGSYRRARSLRNGHDVRAR